jgi:SAM-dependent methyltransferase
MTSSDWNARYSRAERVWGPEPNRFVAAELAGLRPGRALDLACGEGRNAVWLAERGWTVTGVDFSDVAIARARELAATRRVEADFRLGDVLREPIPAASFDLVVLAYVQLPPGEREVLLRRAVDAAAPGGTLFLVGHDLRNHAEGHGGPSDPSLLWTVGEVTAALVERGATIERAEEVLRDVEGAARPAIDTLVRAVLTGA